VRWHSLPNGLAVLPYVQFDQSGSWTALSSWGGIGSTAAGTPPTAVLDFETYAGSPGAFESVEVRLDITRSMPSSTDWTPSAEITRWTLKALPQPSTVDETLEIPIVMRREVLTDVGDGVPYPINVPAEIAYLKNLERTRQLITIQIGSETISSCFVLGSEFRPDTWGPGRQYLEGTYVLQVSTARG
jgi:hypothetical protein